MPLFQSRNSYHLTSVYADNFISLYIFNSMLIDGYILYNDHFLVKNSDRFFLVSFFTSINSGLLYCDIS